MSDFDFDLTDSDLQLGIEVEYPECKDVGVEYRGGKTIDLQRSIPSHSWPNRLGHPAYDSTVGLEVVSGVLPVADVPAWYGDVVDYVTEEHNCDYNPVGILDTGETAGTHIHISPLSESEARSLFELSQEPWAKVFFCSSVALDEDGSVSWPVFRGGSYCRWKFNCGERNAHYAAVNQRGPEHWEWRLPEPMLVEHMGIVAKFLAFFKQDPDIARDYARELLEAKDDRITAIWRTKQAGLDVPEIPEVTREAARAEPTTFYETVEESWSLPRIYTVEFADQEFYVFESGLDGQFTAAGVQFSADDVLQADTLQTVPSALASRIRQAFHAGKQEERRETEATNELKSILNA